MLLLSTEDNTVNYTAAGTIQQDNTVSISTGDDSLQTLPEVYTTAAC